jgi:hypothetical protein
VRERAAAGVLRDLELPVARRRATDEWNILMDQPALAGGGLEVQLAARSVRGV